MNPTPDTPTTTCCDQAGDRAGWPKLLWPALHELGHSRVPFHPETLAELLGIDNEVVIFAVRLGVTEGWLDTVPTESYMVAATGLFVGRLTPKR